MKNKKKFIIFLFVLTILLCTAGICFFLTKKKDDFVAKVNGDFIPKSYWTAVMEEKRSDVLGTYPSGFQDKEAVAALKEEALNECIRRQIILQLAKREDLIEFTDYVSLVDKMEQENLERKQKIKEGGVVYGLQEYNQQTYFTYLFANLIPDLLVKLKEKELKTEEEEILDCYKNHPELKQEAPERASIVLWKMDENSALTKEEQINILAGIREQIMRDNTPDEETPDQIIRTEITVSRDSRTISRSPIMEKEVFQLRNGEVSQVIQDGNQYYLIYCHKYYEQEELGFEQVKSSIEKALLNEKFDQLIEQKEKEADIYINQSVYDKTKAE